MPVADASSQVAGARLRAGKQRILALWEQRVREQLAEARCEDRPTLLDSMPEVIDRLSEILEGAPAPRTLRDDEITLARRHGEQRAALPEYSLPQVITEYHLLRTTILEILDEEGPSTPVVVELLSEVFLLAVREAAGEFADRRNAAAAAQLRDTDARFRHMIEAVKDYAIFTVDPGGFITSWNNGCTRMKQYTSDEAVGQHFSMLYPEEGRRRDEPMGHLRTAAIEGRFRGEGVRRRKNGDLFLADVSITPLYDEGTLTGFAKVVQDLTERNALVQERDLSRTDSTRLRAEAEDRERFVTRLSHDLRSPLATAKMGAELIAAAPHDAAQVRSWADRLVKALQRADQMIGDLLDASRLDAGEPMTLAFDRCDLGAIAGELRDEFAVRHGDRFVTELDGDMVGFWNPDGLRSMLDNLLSNAVKYGDRTQPITIRIRRVDDRVLISVHNFGSIIPLEEQQKLFRRFHRAPVAQASHTPGWGIGLALVKGIAEAHHGVVKAESYPIEGTTFTVDLPIDARAKPDRT
ncbi:MAG TPA: PAS domain-containing sensor histidine kinase [Kofleriaceae bacterium]